MTLVTPRKSILFNQPCPIWRRRQWHPTPVLLPGKSHGWRSLVGCIPWGHKESDKTERLHFHFSLSCIGEGNGNSIHCSCLENPRDGRAWWAAIYGVAQSRPRLKRLSSSSSISFRCMSANFFLFLFHVTKSTVYSYSLVSLLRCPCPLLTVKSVNVMCTWKGLELKEVIMLTTETIFFKFVSNLREISP